MFLLKFLATSVLLIFCLILSQFEKKAGFKIGLLSPDDLNQHCNIMITNQDYNNFLMA